MLNGMQYYTKTPQGPTNETTCWGKHAQNSVKKSQGID